MPKKKSAKNLVIILILLGGLTGLLLSLIDSSSWSITTKSFFQSILAINAMLLAFAIPCRPIKFIITALPIIIIYSLLFAYFQHITIKLSILYNTASYLLLYLSLFIAYCYQQTILLAPDKSQWQTYLMETSWNTVFTLFLSSLFTLICWLVLLCTAMLFNYFDIKIVATIIRAPVFVYTCSGVLLGIGIANCRKYQKLILSLRQLFFTLCYFLLPIISVITLLLFITYLSSTTKHQSDSFTFLSICLLIILLVNAVHQYKTLPYNRYIRYLVNLMIFVLPAIPLIILYKQTSLLFSYGIKPILWQNMIVALLIFLYALTYFFCLFNREVWLKYLPISNCILAIIVLIAGILTNFPGLTPAQLSLNNQISRILSNKPIINEALHHGAYLRAANLKNKNLSGINLAYSDLSYANLTGANLNNANLNNSYLTRANLTKATLDNANLDYAWFFSANMTDTSLKGTRLPRTLNDVTGLTQQQLDQACSAISYKLANGLIVKACKKP